jgi:hypothetical protein
MGRPKGAEMKCLVLALALLLCGCGGGGGGSDVCDECDFDSIASEFFDCEADCFDDDCDGDILDQDCLDRCEDRCDGCGEGLTCFRCDLNCEADSETRCAPRDDFVSCSDGDF